MHSTHKPSPLISNPKMQTLASLSLYSPTPHPRLPPTTMSTLPHQLQRRPSSVLCSLLPAGGLYPPTPHSHHPRLPLTMTCSLQLRRRRSSVSCSSLPATGDGGGGDHDDDFQAFAEAAKDFNLIPLCKTLFTDEVTPTTAYWRLTKEDDDPYSPSFISTLPSGNGRYTLIGAQPAVEFVAKENFVTVIDGWEGSRREEFVEDPMRLLKRMMEKWKPQPLVGLPDTFCGGWFGYFSYDTFRYVEKKLPFSSAPKDDRYLSDIDVCLYDEVIVFDHVEQKAYLIHWVLLDRYASVETAFLEGKSRLDSLFSKVQDGILPGFGKALHSYIFDSSSLSSNMTKEEYRRAVVKAKKSIGVGDHIVLSQRFQRSIGTDPFSVYRILGSEHSSPFRTYLKGRMCVLVSTSQEILVFLKQGKITKRALSWAEKRGKIPEVELETLLLGDEKERAKHMRMLDLEKIDISKVTGEMFEHLSCWDVLQAALPSAVVSGSPKAKAIELIDQLEQSRRGPYGGGVGCISFFGDMEMSVTSDLIVFKTGTRVAHIQVGVTIKGAL
ncbi:hypothetical protein RHGRI_024482 [Rhododendron griersonianum]|uniref:Anthranilate synthase n=1 Tax=Rhododendron griersonianum TaxID=479676 RepID=A0AAV6JB45_9ERIC|nr:hypothetical protein RHGRI_024482 [Rhododendron griersonianum]